MLCYSNDFAAGEVGKNLNGEDQENAIGAREFLF